VVRIQSKTGPSRPSFTLIEMMVVVAIIAILMALTAAAIMAVNKQAYAKASQGTIDKLAPVVHKLDQAVLDQAIKEPIPSWASAALNGLSTTSSGGTSDAARARVWWVKSRYKQAFPQTFAEAFTPVSIPPTGGILPTGFTMPGLPGYISFLSSKGITGTSAGSLPQQTQRAESAICLLMALQRNASGVALTADTLSPSNIVEFPTNSPGVTLPGLVDAWGMPLQFCRWPTQDNTLNPFKNPVPVNPTIAAWVTPAGNPLTVQPYDPTVYPNGIAWNGFNDPQDPQGTLTATTWAQPTNPRYMLFQQVFHDLPPAPGPSSPPATPWPLSYKLKPVITSAGPDQLWTKTPSPNFPLGWGPGLDPRTSRQICPACQDNLDNLKGQ